MIKRRKRILIICLIIITFGVCLLIRCIQFKSDTSEAEDVTTGLMTGCTFGYSSMGIFNIDDDSMINYIDAKSDEKVYVCNKANCEHEHYDEVNNPEPICAASANNMQGIIPYGDYIYLIGYEVVDAGMGDKILYREDIDGSNRKEILTIDNSSLATLCKAVCNGKYLIVTYNNTLVEDKSGKINTSSEVVSGIYIIDLEKNTFEDIPIQSGDKQYCDAVSIDGDNVYISMYYMDNTYDNDTQIKLIGDKADEYCNEHLMYGYYCYDIENERMSIEEKNRNLYNNPVLYKHYCLEYTKDKILQIYDSTSGETTQICENDDGVECLIPVDMTENKLCYKYYDKTTKLINWYEYDIAQKKVIKLCSNSNNYVDAITDDYVYCTVYDKNNSGSSYKSMTWDDFAKLSEE